jgi:hypothetical protein
MDDVYRINIVMDSYQSGSFYEATVPVKSLYVVSIILVVMILVICLIAFTCYKLIPLDNQPYRRRRALSFGSTCSMSSDLSDELPV